MRKGMSCSDAGKLGAVASAEHWHSVYKHNLDSYSSSPKVCLWCGNIIPYDRRWNKFCSHSCSASYNNRRREYKNDIVLNNSKHKTRSKVSPSPLLCENCGKQIKGKGVRYCSTSCSATARWRATVNEIDRCGEFKVAFGGEANRKVVKRYLTEKVGHRCCICGITEWQGRPAPLVVDHIDGDPTNCKIENFRLVCGNCDMQLPTYKSKNKHGRTWRRKYNKEP